LQQFFRNFSESFLIAPGFNQDCQNGTGAIFLAYTSGGTGGIIPVNRLYPSIPAEQCLECFETRSHERVCRDASRSLRA
jgi:hypothetical protein